MPVTYVYGGVTLYAMSFQTTSTSITSAIVRDPYTTCPCTYRTGIQFGLFPFRSLLLRESHLFSFPARTKMLQFRAFPIRE